MDDAARRLLVFTEGRNFKVITPDYTLLSEVERLAGAEVHLVAQPLNAYTLAVRGLRESTSPEDKSAFTGILERSEGQLRSFLCRKRLEQLNSRIL